jgi:hypothetical protein
MLTKLTVLFVSGILGISYDYLNKREKNTKLVYFLLILFLSGMFAFREYIFENPGTDYFEYNTGLISSQYIDLEILHLTVLVSMQ